MEKAHRIPFTTEMTCCTFRLTNFPITPGLATGVKRVRAMEKVSGWLAPFQALLHFAQG